MQEIADMVAKTTEVQGNGEKQVATVMASRRKFLQLDAKLKVIEAFETNPNLKIFGDNNDNVLS